MIPTKTIVYLLLVIIAAYIIFFITSVPQSFWIVWSTFVFSLISLGQTFYRRIGLIALLATISALAAFIASLCAYSIIALAIFLFLLTFACILFVERYPEFLLIAFVVPIFGILGGSITSSFSGHFFKLFLILGGGVIVMMAQFMFFYKFQMDQAHYWLLIAVEHLKVLSDEIFSCFQPAYTNNVYLFERRIHLQKTRFMRAMYKIREFHKALGLKSIAPDEVLAQDDDARDIVSPLENLYDILLDCSQLRNRISDSTIFSVCTQEMNGLITEINELFTQLKSSIDKRIKVDFSTLALTQKIMRFDELNQNVLQVTAREPSGFILFIASIKKLEQEMQTFYVRLSANEFV